MGNKLFKPTNKMLALLEAYVLLEPNEIATNVLLGMRADVHPNTIWKWESSGEFEGFQNWWDGEIRKLLKPRLDRVWGAMYRAGCKGDTSAAKLFIERFDPNYKPVKKTESHVVQEVTLATGQRSLGQAMERFEAMVAESEHEE